MSIWGRVEWSDEMIAMRRAATEGRIRIGVRKMVGVANAAVSAMLFMQLLIIVW